MKRILLSIALVTPLLWAALWCGGGWQPPPVAAKTVAAARAVDALALPVGTVNQPYRATLESDGGVAPYSFTLQSGALPNGITFNHGVFSGTPTQLVCSPSP